MNERCNVCNGIGKVDKDFGLGNCKEIPNDSRHCVCPGCDGKGIQYERETSHPHGVTVIKKKCKKKPSRYIRKVK